MKARIGVATLGCLTVALAADRAPVALALTPQETAQTAAFKQLSISRADAVAELDTLVRAIDNVHPNPYFIRSREASAAERERIAAGLPDTLTAREWWSRLSRLVAGISDGHTTMGYPADGFVEQFVMMRQQAPDPSKPRAPVRLRAFPRQRLGLDEHGHLLVTSSGDGAGGLTRGDRLLTINGRSVDALVADWTLETSGDSPANRAASVVDEFPMLLLVHGMHPPYTVTVADGAGAERTVAVEGTPMAPDASAPRPPEYFSFRKVDTTVGYMDFFTMDGDRGRFKKALASMFRQVASDGVRTLIVDLRRNGGGYEELGNDLLSYVTTKPYRNWGRREIKRSAEMRAFARTEYIPAAIRWLPVQYLIPDGRAFFTGEVGTMGTWPAPMPKARRPSRPFFTGAVCVLTGPRTFSAAVILADTIKTYELATIVGEETGGRPNMYSATYEFALPHSHLAVAISAAHSVRANGDERDMRGVVPDIVVPTTAADIRAGRDPVVERARDCPPLGSDRGQTWVRPASGVTEGVGVS